MGKFIFVIGGARSGKSSYAVKLAKKLNKKTAFIATADASDTEMRQRIKKHKLSRPRSWKLIEEGRAIGAVLRKLKSGYEVVLIDCLGLLVSNLLEGGLKDADVKARLKKFTSIILKSRGTMILVSNEVGSGIVPASPLARRFRDLVGLANQMLAKEADEVIFMQSGIPMMIKGEEKHEKNK